MILVLSLNSAVDKTYRVPSFRRGLLHRPESELALPGGKGINVARVLRRFGEPVRVLGCVAGSTGRFIRDRVAAEGIAADWIELEGESRQCVAVISRDCDTPTEINEAGPLCRPADVARVRKRVLQLLPKTDILVCSGSLPRGVPADFYAGLIRDARARGVATALDTSGPALAEGLRAGPRLAKPNEPEMRELLNGDGGKSPRAQLDRLLDRGVEMAVVTLAEKGLVAAESRSGRYWRVTPPRLRTVNPIGCGDTLLAGLVLGWREGWGMERSLKEAAAMAAANTLVLGAGIYRDEDRKKILSRIRLRQL